MISLTMSRISSLAASLLGFDALCFFFFRSLHARGGFGRIDLCGRGLGLELFQHRLLGGVGGFAAIVVVLEAHAVGLLGARTTFGVRQREVKVCAPT